MSPCLPDWLVYICIQKQDISLQDEVLMEHQDDLGQGRKCAQVCATRIQERSQD